MADIKNTHIETLCAHLGRGKTPKSGFVNPPSTRGSSYLSPTLAEFKDSESNSMKVGGLGYGRYGSQTTRELEQMLATLDGAYGAMITSSGFSAISTSILACVAAGDHILMVDSAYEPTRVFCGNTLSKMNVETTFYSAGLGANIAALIQPNTKLIYTESPGSLTLEVQDLDSIISVAKQHNILTMLDNTWATSINYPAISKGINIAIQSATKYIGGHSDLMMGVITTDEENWSRVRKSYIQFGHSPGTEETMLALRGLRTLPCRLKQHAQSAIQIAEWLEARDEVIRVNYPALTSSPDHQLFKQQYRAASGLLSFIVTTSNQAAICEMVENMLLFSIGVSWAGYESLILPADPTPIRTATPWSQQGTLIRLSIGLEHPDDLIKDLEAGFDRLNTNMRPQHI